MIQLEESRLLNSLDFEPYLTCESCLQREITKSPFKSKQEHAKDLLELIHASQHYLNRIKIRHTQFTIR